MKTPEQKRKAVEATQRWRAAHPERAKAVQKAANAAWRLRHPEKELLYGRQKVARKPELYAAIHKAKAERNPGLYRMHRAASCRKHQAAKLQRSPAWADQEKIKDVYAQAQAAREFFPEVEWHVDHVLPLQGKWVSGLHVHENLQVLPGSENRKKAARFQVEFRKDMRDLVRAA